MLSTMPNFTEETFPIDTKMIENEHYIILRYEYPKPGSKHKPGDPRGIGGSIMFAIDVRPKNGLDLKEVEIIKAFVLAQPWILYYSIGVEGSEEAKSLHMHVRVVTRELFKANQMKSQFEQLLHEDRMTIKFDKNGKNRRNISMLISACAKENKTPLMHLAYPAKFGSALGTTRDDISPSDYNNGTTHLTNLFDGETDCSSDMVSWWQQQRFTFQHELHRQQIKQIAKSLAPRNITSGRACEMARDYAEKTDHLTWSKENLPKILATMLTDKDGEVKYDISWNSFRIKSNVVQDLNYCKLDDDYKHKLDLVFQVHYQKRIIYPTKDYIRNVNKLQDDVKNRNETIDKKDGEIERLKKQNDDDDTRLWREIDRIQKTCDTIKSKLNKCMKRLRENGDGQWLEENNEKPKGESIKKRKLMRDIICSTECVLFDN